MLSSHSLFRITSLSLALLAIVGAATAFAQTTQFTYQGLLNDGGGPAGGSYDLQFRLFDAAVGGTQIGTDAAIEDVPVSAGLFRVTLDFGAAAFPGANRWLEIGVRPGASVGAFTTLSPRQQLNSTPYAVRSLSAASAGTATNAATATNATNAATAANALQLGGQPASQYVLTDDTRLSDARSPTAGSEHYIQNTTTTQASSNFNISGNGTAGGTFSGNLVNAVTQFNLNGNRVLSVAGAGNLFAGVGSGTNNTTGVDNVFLGPSAGALNATGSGNALVGRSAGVANMGGLNNSFFGAFAGAANTNGGENAFLGRSAGSGNTTGSSNVFVGYLAGSGNAVGLYNTMLGSNANVGANNLSFATALGAGATVSTSNTLVLGRNLDTVQVPGNLQVSGTFTANVINAITQFNLNGSRLLSAPGTGNLFAGVSAGTANTTGSNNAFFGYGAGAANTTSSTNSFFGSFAGNTNTSGTGNSFFGSSAGRDNTSGFSNAFFGGNAGLVNTTGSSNAFFGYVAGTANTTGSHNAFFGPLAGNENTTGGSNSFFGSNAGRENVAGVLNSFFGQNTGLNTKSDSNSFFGAAAGQTNTTGFNNTLLGASADVGANNLFYATAIGSGAVVSTSATIVLGRSAAQDTVHVPGKLVVGTLGAATNNHLCINQAGELAICASSLRYKQNVAPLTAGMKLLNRLRPVTFQWKGSQERDLGLIAEEVAAAEPLLVTYNAAGEIQGVKYDQLNVVLINALKEQQTLLQQQQSQIQTQQIQLAAQQQQHTLLQQQLQQQRDEMKALKRLVCLANPRATACRNGQAKQ